ncbi:MAG: hypothetical protein L0Z53_16860 [Acidobacteriales bacterium]|nr:hypothetical protein [Terriglobales bacterium]
MPRRICLTALLLVSLASFAADDLKLNPHLDYDSDSQDGPLITGANPQAGAVKGRVNYIIMFEPG